MNKHSHFIEICIKCKTIISQCRCPSPDKEKRHGLCEECLSKEVKEGR